MIKQSKMLLFLLLCIASMDMQGADMNAGPADQPNIAGDVAHGIQGIIGAVNATATIGAKIYQGVQWAYEHPKSTAALGCASAYGLYKASHSTPVRFAKNATLITAGALVAYRTLVADEETKNLIIQGCNTVLEEVHALERRVTNVIRAARQESSQESRLLAARLDRIEAHLEMGERQPDALDQPAAALEPAIPDQPRVIERNPGILRRGWNWFTSPCDYNDFNPDQNPTAFI